MPAVNEVTEKLCEECGAFPTRDLREFTIQASSRWRSLKVTAFDRA